MLFNLTPPLKTSIITAEYRDMRDGFCLFITVEHEARFDNAALVQQMRKAAAAYAVTERGIANPQVKNGTFNWGDLCSELPESLCKAHGFRIVDTHVATIVLDHDERILENA